MTMKKMLAVALGAIALAGCADTTGGSAVTAQQLQHHRFVLQSVNGTALTTNKQHTPELSFGENMHVSGNMCNRFTGQGKLRNNILTVDGMAATRMMCIDPQMNQLDNVIGNLLNQGARITLTGKTLTLTGQQNTLTYTLSDLVQ